MRPRRRCRPCRCRRRRSAPSPSRRRTNRRPRGRRWSRSSPSRQSGFPARGVAGGVACDHGNVVRGVAVEAGERVRRRRRRPNLRSAAVEVVADDPDVVARAFQLTPERGRRGRGPGEPGRACSAESCRAPPIGVVMSVWISEGARAPGCRSALRRSCRRRNRRASRCRRRSARCSSRRRCSLKAFEATRLPLM